MLYHLIKKRRLERHQREIENKKKIEALAKSINERNDRFEVEKTIKNRTQKWDKISTES